MKGASPLIGQVAAIGDGRPYNTALIVLDADFAPAWAAKNGLEGASIDDLAAHEGMRAAVQAGVDAGNARLARVEQVKKFTILKGDWAPGGEELTPTMKLKRRPIAAKYADEIEAMYREIAGLAFLRASRVRVGRMARMRMTLVAATATIAAFAAPTTASAAGTDCDGLQAADSTTPPTRSSRSTRARSAVGHFEPARAARSPSRAPARAATFERRRQDPDPLRLRRRDHDDPQPDLHQRPSRSRTTAARSSSAATACDDRGQQVLLQPDGGRRRRRRGELRARQAGLRRQPAWRSRAGRPARQHLRRPRAGQRRRCRRRRRLHRRELPLRHGRGQHLLRQRLGRRPGRRVEHRRGGERHARRQHLHGQRGGRRRRRRRRSRPAGPRSPATSSTSNKSDAVGREPRRRRPLPQRQRLLRHARPRATRCPTTQSDNRFAQQHGRPASFSTGRGGGEYDREPRGRLDQRPLRRQHGSRAPTSGFGGGLGLRRLQLDTPLDGAQPGGHRQRRSRPPSSSPPERGAFFGPSRGGGLFLAGNGRDVTSSRSRTRRSRATPPRAGSGIAGRGQPRAPR